MATEQTITISGTPTVVSGVTVPYTLSSDLEIYIGKGLVEKVVLNNAGAGYATVSNAALEFSGGGGSSAALTVDVASGQVSLDNAGVPTNKGTGYTTSPIVGFGNLTGGTGASATAEIYAKKISGTDYTLSGSSGSTTITFTSALADGDKVLVKRVTGVSTAINTFNAGSSITAADLNKSFDQIRYKVEELPTVTSTAVTNGVKDDISVAGNNWTIVDTAVTTAKIADDAVDSSKLANNIDIAGTFDVTGASTLDSTLGVAGNFSVNTNKFTVAGSDGDTTIAGTLGVTGVTTLTGALAANAGITVDTDKFTVADSTGNTAIDGTLDVDGATTLDGTTVDGVLDVNGSATIDNVQINGNEIDTTSGNLTLDSNGGTVTIDDNTTISGTLTTAALKAVTLPGPVIFGPGSELTVDSAGAITVTGSYHTLITHDAGDSDLITINSNPAAVKGQFLILEADGISYTIACKETGNMKIQASAINIGGSAAHKDIISFIYDGEKWCQIAFSQDN